MLPLKITPGAAAQIQQAAQWWAANRPKAPQALHEELRRGFELISRHPNIGSRATNARLAGVRRIHLSRIRYFLYYRVRPGRVEVLAFWHSSRGKSPTL
jgi:plasmid stabilization system protein ParE